MMIPPLILERTTELFPAWHGGKIAVFPIVRGGSDRSFFRLTSDSVASPSSVILIRYGSQREENKHYVQISNFLASLGIQVPAIYEHDEQGQWIWMEDLGERDLWSFREAPWTTRRALYSATLAQVRNLHRRGLQPLAGTDLVLQPVFDATLYRWEQDYFFENCAGRVFNADTAGISRCAFDDIAEALASLPRVLVHRDLQSQNVMINASGAFLIDYQGLRPGLAEYDLASLLYDPYVALSLSERQELLEIYLEGPPADFVAFQRTFDLCALQRLMQALGAYGFLGLVKEKRHYLDFIPGTLRSLRDVTLRISGLDEFTAFLDRLLSK